MIHLILLLLSLTCCETVEVKAVQPLYEGKENQDITLEWTFRTEADSSPDSLSISCFMTKDHKVSMLLETFHGEEVVKFQLGQFAGRVKFDKDAVKEGRIRLHVSSLRTEDSGQFVCEVRSKSAFGSDKCSVFVTAARREL